MRWWVLALAVVAVAVVGCDRHSTLPAQPIPASLQMGGTVTFHARYGGGPAWGATVWIAGERPRAVRADSLGRYSILVTNPGDSLTVAGSQQFPTGDLSGRCTAAVPAHHPDMTVDLVLESWTNW